MALLPGRVVCDDHGRAGRPAWRMGVVPNWSSSLVRAAGRGRLAHRARPDGSPARSAHSGRIAMLSAPASAYRAAAGAAPAHTPPDRPCPDPAPPPAPPPDRHRRLHPSPESFPGNRLQPGGRPQEPNRDGKSRTLVLVATMRSPTTGSPDQTQKRAHCAKNHRPRRATAPDFPACAGVPKGPRNSKLGLGDGTAI